MISRIAAGSCIDFCLVDLMLYLTGTKEGLIRRYSISYIINVKKYYGYLSNIL
jgi:hypothetical protein